MNTEFLNSLHSETIKGDPGEDILTYTLLKGQSVLLQTRCYKKPYL